MLRIVRVVAFAHAVVEGLTIADAAAKYPEQATSVAKFGSRK